MGWMASAARSRTCRSSVRPSALLAPRERRRRRASLRETRAASIDLSTATICVRGIFSTARATRRRGAPLLDRQPSRLLLIARAQLSGQRRMAT